MRRASSRERTSPTSRLSPSQMANSTMEAVSGMGEKYVPSSVASEPLRKTCSTCVVATCAPILVSILMDLTGSARGMGRGRGGTGQRRQGPGTMTPCALAVAVTSAIISTPKKRHSRSLKVRIPFLLKNILRGFKTFLLRIAKATVQSLERFPLDFLRAGGVNKDESRGV